MATIITKNSSTASSVPTNAQLVQGELAVNVTDKRLFTENASGTVVELGTNPSSLALPNGSVNGVPYLNASKVLTTGSALTFDGTRLGVGGAYSGSSYLKVYGDIEQSATTLKVFTNNIAVVSSSSNLLLDASSASIAFNAGSSEQMRLTSTGLGIGTSSPGSYGKLAVQTDGGTGNAIAGYSPSTSNGAKLRLYDNYSSAGIEGIPVTATASTDLSFVAGGSSLMRLTSSGNLGLGVTPSAWATSGTILKALQIGAAGSFAAGASDPSVHVSQNAYFDGSSWRYIQSAAAGNYYVSGNTHNWRIAGSGTAGNAITFTQALTLDSSGRLLVGLTSAASTNANIQTNKPINLAGYTVATLPSGTLGDMAYVTDALAPTFLGTIVGGGTIKTPVFYNGTNWVAH